MQEGIVIDHVNPDQDDSEDEVEMGVEALDYVPSTDFDYEFLP